MKKDSFIYTICCIVVFILSASLASASARDGQIPEAVIAKMEDTSTSNVNKPHKGVTIFVAKKIITMDPEEPTATAVAVYEGRILGVGSLDELKQAISKADFPAPKIDRTFADKVLMPGLVDVHSHLQVQALIYSGEFMSKFPWPTLDGGMTQTYSSKDEVLERLRVLDVELPPGQLLYASSYDPVEMGGRIQRSELDAISTTRPILISETTFHFFYVNSAVLERAGITRENMPSDFRLDDEGNTGWVAEARGVLHLAKVVPAIGSLLEAGPEKLRALAPLFTSSGVTTVVDAAVGASNLEMSLKNTLEAFSGSDSPLRVAVAPFTLSVITQMGSIDKAVDRLVELKKWGNDKVFLGPIKLYVDGSIPAKETPLAWPGKFWDGTPGSTHWQFAPEKLIELLIALNREKLFTITHCVSRIGIDAWLDALEVSMLDNPWMDHRHSVHHAYYMTEAQMRKTKNLGGTVSFLTGPSYYYGKNHIALMGPDLGSHVNPAGRAERLDLSWTMHVDPPGAPQLNWLGMASFAVNRVTIDGIALAEAQKVGVAEALKAMTIEAAYQIHLDHEIGSISYGKLADFAVLLDDPLKIKPKDLGNVRVWGTVLSGLVFPARN